MKNNKIFFGIFFLFFFLIFNKNIYAKKICGLTTDKIILLNYINNYAKKFKASDGMTFNNAISTIFLLESNIGEEWLGDINKKNKNTIITNLVEGSFGPGQIKISTALIMIKKYPYLWNKYGYLYHNNVFALYRYNKYFKKMAYYYRILHSKTWNNRWKQGKRLKVKKWALNEFKYWSKKYKKYEEAANKDLKIIENLKNNLDFSIEIGTHYLIYNYEIAKKRKMTYPYYRAISAYNGGWNNKNYLERFFKYKKYIDCLKRKKIFN